VTRGLDEAEILGRADARERQQGKRQHRTCGTVNHIAAPCDHQRVRYTMGRHAVDERAVWVWHS
jgi:hypothetical protein